MIFPSTTTCSGGAGTVCLRDGKHKAAIALNNDTVSLLGRGYYREALDTFKDSMQLIRSASMHMEEAVFQEEISAEDIHIVLSRSWQRAAQCKNTVSQQAAFKNSAVIQVVSSQYNPTSIYTALTSYTKRNSSTLYAAFPMTIDPIDFEDWDENEVDFQSAAILYNFAVAYDCLAVEASQSGNDSLGKTLQEKTYSVFCMANGLLQKLTTRHVGEQAFVMTCFATRLLLLQTFLTHALVQACDKLDLQLDYQVHCENLEHLLHTIAVQQSMLWMADHGVAAAA